MRSRKPSALCDIPSDISNCGWRYPRCQKPAPRAERIDLRWASNRVIVRSAVCSWWPQEKRAGASLIGSEHVAARTHHVLFEQRYARDVDQQPVHADRTHHCQPTQRIAPERIERDQRVGEPSQPLKEVVGMARPGPKARVADHSFIAGVRLEGCKLTVRNCFASYRNCKNCSAEEILQSKPVPGLCAAMKIVAKSGIETRAWICTN